METKEVVDQIQKEWKELKELLTTQAADEVKKYGARLGDTDAKLNEFSARIDGLEVRLQRPGGIGGTPKSIDKDSPEMKAFGRFLRKGQDALKPEEVKLLTVGDDSQGGFGAPAEFDATIIKGVIEISPMRSLVSVRNTSMRSVRVMKRTGTFSAVWVGEVDTRTETEGLTYGMEEIPTHEVYAMVDISKQDLEDTAFDLEGELRGEFTEQFAYAEGLKMISGNGVAAPEGILENAAVAEETTGDANNLTYAGLVDVSHNGKEQYLANARFLFSLRTLGKLRLMLDSNNVPLWTPMAAGAPATVLGFPYTIVPGMPTVAAGNTPIAFGDFQRGYRLVDRINNEIERDPYTQANRGAIRFYARKRLGGQVVLAEAIRKLTVSA